jgi:outer membrane protein OmpA-like peptidoglycan-associated protein
MMIRSSLTVILVLLRFYSMSQSLISNGSFEYGIGSLTNIVITRENFTSYVKDWSGNVTSSPPYICTCNYKNTEFHEQLNICALPVKPTDGCKMLQMGYQPNCLDWNHENRGNGSCVGTRLSKPLSIGKVYRLSLMLYIPQHHQQYDSFARNIGVNLTLNWPYNPAGSLLHSSGILIDSVIYDQWFQQSWLIRPTCELEYLFIGVMRDSLGPPISNQTYYMRYFLDQVQLVEVPLSDKEISAIQPHCVHTKDDSQSNLTNNLGGKFQVFFDNRVSIISSKSVETIDSIEEIGLKSKRSTFIVVGHTDNTNPSKNHELSKERAQSVRQKLLEAGVEDWRILCFGAGDRFPVAENSTEIGRSLNRRAEVSINISNSESVLYRNILEKVRCDSFETARRYLSLWLNIANQQKALTAWFDLRLESVWTTAYKKQYLQKLKKKYNNKDADTNFFLDSLWAEDQYYRTLGKYVENLNYWSSTFDSGDSFLDMNPNCSDSLLLVRDSTIFCSLIKKLEEKKLNFVPISLFGKRTAKNTFLIFQHAPKDNLDKMNAYLKHLELNCLKGEADWNWYAHLYDRIQLIDDKPQRYGTQYTESEDGKSKLLPIEDEGKVNQFRIKIGLTPISDIK